jgi:hypothetical protein
VSADEPLLERTRENIRRAEVMREFGEQDADEWDAAEHALYLAPWRDQLVDGTLGPWHGPTTESRYNEQVRRFDEECRGGIGSGSLWDSGIYESMHSTRSSTKKATRQALRSDIDAVAEVVRWLGFLPKPPKREIDVFYAYWRDGLSVRQTAVRLGIGEQSVEGWIKALRRRARLDDEADSEKPSWKKSRAEKIRELAEAQAREMAEEAGK